MIIFCVLYFFVLLIVKEQLSCFFSCAELVNYIETLDRACLFVLRVKEMCKI